MATCRSCFSAAPTRPGWPASNAAPTLAILRPIDAAEFLAQLHMLLRNKERHDQLALKAAEAQRISQRLQAATQQMDQEMELARRLQESFLPQQLPRLPGVRFAVKYKPARPRRRRFLRLLPPR